MPADYTVWTAHMEQRLLQLIDKGVTYDDCAKILSGEFKVKLTKNACVGKGRRMQVPLRMPARKGRLCQRRKKQSLRTRNLPRSERRKKARASLMKQRLRHRSSLRRPPQPRQLLTLLQLTKDSCRWPIGDRAPYLFCGHARTEGSSYCLRHAIIASPGRGRAR